MTTILTRFIPLLGKRMIKLLIDSLDSIDTNQQTFDVPPLPGEVDRTAIYNRECYNYYRSFILSNKNEDLSRFLIIGNPGIGKTYFGRLMLVVLLKRGNTVVKVARYILTLRVKLSQWIVKSTKVLHKVRILGA